MKYILRLIVNKECNFGCFFCNQEGIAYSTNKVLNTENFASLVQSFSSVASISKIRITGGEPLIYKEMETLLKELRHKFPTTNIGFTTNGSLPNRLFTILDTFKNDRHFQINISVPSLQAETYRKITLSSVESNIISLTNHLVALGYSSKVSINHVYLPSINDTELSAIVNFAKERGMRLKIMQLVVNDYNTAAINSYAIPDYSASLIEDKVRELGYAFIDSETSKYYQSYEKQGHKISVVDCYFHNPIKFFRIFKTLRISYDGKVGVNGDGDGFMRHINLKNPSETFSEILSELNTAEQARLSSS